MNSAQTFTLEGVHKEKEEAVCFEKEDLKILIHARVENTHHLAKAIVKQTVDAVQNLDFSQPIEDLQRFFKPFVEQEDLEIDILIVKQKNDVLYAGARGQVYLFLKREGETYPIFEPKSAPQTVSGQIQENDIYVLTTAAGKEFLDETGEIPTSNLTNFTQELSLKLAKNEAQQKIAAMFLQIPKTPEIESVAAPSEPPETTAEPASAPQEITPPVLQDQPALQEIKQPPLQKFFSLGQKLLIFFNLRLIRLTFVLILALGIIFAGYKIINNFWAESQKKIAAETKKIEKLQSEFNDAKSLLDLNNVRAQELAGNAIDEVKKMMLAKLVDPQNQKKLEELKTNLEKTLKDASKIVETKAELSYTTTLLNKKSTVSDFSLNGFRAAILDAGNSAVYSVDLSNRKADTFDLKKYDTAQKFLTVNSDNVFVLNSEGIVQINTLDKKVKTALKKDKEWKEITAFSSYAGNLYLLDVGAAQIWKYSESEGGFSTIKPYFSTKVDLANAVSMGIDSDVFVLFKDGKIKKYLSGAEQSFEFKIPDKPLSAPTRLVINDKLDNIYVLEPKQKRIVILDKKGKYVGQVVDNKIAGATSFGVNESEKLMFFCVGSEIYKISY